MTEPIILAFLFLLFGLVIGGLIGRLIAKNQMTTAVPRGELDKQYVTRGQFEDLQTRADIDRDNLMIKEEKIRELTAENASLKQSRANLEEKLANQREEMLALQERSRIEFENVANRLLEEKSRKFTLQNHEKLNDILAPLKEKIKSFEEGIEKRFLEETRDRASLQTEIAHLRLLNQQLSEDANNLVGALKGENKTQGDWGEFQLELLLEKAGLQKNIHYHTQLSFTDQDGRQKRPDFIINLPEGKHLVIDSKVSLVAYEQFFNAGKPEKREKFLKKHCESLRNHIKDLGSKNYQHLYQINSPDYLLLFVPIEPAFSVALQSDGQLFNDALDRNIVIVTASTLLATMRTVAFIWTQEKQKSSVLEIARQSGLLYDKFCNFVEDLRSVGLRLDQAQNAYHDAMYKMTDGKRPGDTLIGRAERIRELGAKTSKTLPRDLLETSSEEE